MRRIESLSIKNLTPGLPEIGKIKIGMKGRQMTSRGGKTFQPPQKLDYFRVTGIERGSDGNFLLDDEAKRRFGDKPKRLPITLLYNDLELNFQSRYAAYIGTNLWCHGDGECAIRWAKNPKDNSKHQIDMACPCPNLDPEFEGRGKCKATGTLSVLIDGMQSVGGVYKFRTTSYNSVVNIMSSLALISRLAGGYIAGIPLSMRLLNKTVEIPTTGKSTVIQVVGLEFEGSPQQLAAAGSRIAIEDKTNILKIEYAETYAKQSLVKEIGPSVLSDEDADIAEEFYPEEVTHQVREENTATMAEVAPEAANVYGAPPVTAVVEEPPPIDDMDLPIVEEEEPPPPAKQPDTVVNQLPLPEVEEELPLMARFEQKCYESGLDHYMAEMYINANPQVAKDPGYKDGYIEMCMASDSTWKAFKVSYSRWDQARREANAEEARAATKARAAKPADPPPAREVAEESSSAAIAAILGGAIPEWLPANPVTLAAAAQCKRLGFGSSKILAILMHAGDLVSHDPDKDIVDVLQVAMRPGAFGGFLRTYEEGGGEWWLSEAGLPSPNAAPVPDPETSPAAPAPELEELLRPEHYKKMRGGMYWKGTGFAAWVIQNKDALNTGTESQIAPIRNKWDAIYHPTAASAKATRHQHHKHQRPLPEWPLTVLAEVKADDGMPEEAQTAERPLSELEKRHEIAEAQAQARSDKQRAWLQEVLAKAPKKYKKIMDEAGLAKRPDDMTAAELQAVVNVAVAQK